MTDRPSLSVVIPAYNEARNILGTLENVTTALAASAIRDPEVLVVDDGSRDETGAIVTANQPRFPIVRLLTNERNMGFGWTYRRGVEAASRDYIVMVHGDNAWGSATLTDLFRRCGEADVVIGYTRDMWRTRSVGRTLASKTFTALINAIAWRRLQYYNGLQIHRATVLKALKIQSTGFGFQPEVLLKALRRTKTYVEVPMDLTERTEGQSKAFRFKNLVDVTRTLVRLCRLEWGPARES